MQLKKICVYCSSSAKIAPVYYDATERVAAELTQTGAEIVFGGGSVGLMGKLADAVLARKGSITGIMPHFMREVEWQHKGVKNFIFTNDMPERKTLLMKNADAIVALPGGCGTLEELFEVITLKRLGRFFRPIVILNTNGFYTPLREMLEKCVYEKFMDPRHLTMWTFVDEPEEILPAIRNAPSWGEEAINFAAS